jgi:hypothetical protein
LPRRPRQQQRDTRFSPSERRAVITAHARPGSGDGQRDCARGDYCSSDKAATRWVDGKREVTPDTSYQAFCDTDRAAIRDALAGFPARHDQLTAELWEHGGDRHRQHGKAAAPPLEYRADVDALMRSLTDTLMSWHGRVAEIPGAEVASYPELDSETRFRCGHRILSEIRTDLVPRLDALLALPPGRMLRTVSPASWRDLLAGEKEASARFPGARRAAALESGEVVIQASLDGTRAGLEILHLDYRCLAILGETDPKPEALDGVRCYRCQQVNTLVRADPPGKPGDPEYYSRCRRRSCGHQMTEVEYRRQVGRLYAAQGGRIVTPMLEPADSGAA